MKERDLARATAAGAALAAVLFAEDAYAYLDPGSGSMLLQLLLGGVAGFLVIARLYWTKVLGFFGIRRKEEPGSPVEGD